MNWRALAGHDNAEAVWNGKANGEAFVELINFSDCEGVIGAEVAKKLAADFAAYQDKAGDKGDFARVYASWRKAFELAADGGAVCFH